MGVQFLRGPCWKGLDRTLTQTFIRHSVRSSRSLGSTFLSLGPLWPEKEEPLLSGAQARPGCGKSRTPEAPVWPPRPSVKCRPHLGDPNLPTPCRPPAVSPEETRASCGDPPYRASLGPPGGGSQAQQCQLQQEHPQRSGDDTCPQPLPPPHDPLVHEPSTPSPPGTPSPCNMIAAPQMT